MQVRPWPLLSLVMVTEALPHHACEAHEQGTDLGATPSANRHYNLHFDAQLAAGAVRDCQVWRRALLEQGPQPA